MKATLDNRGMNNRDELVTDRWTLPTTPVTRTEPRVGGGGGGALGYFLGGFVPPGTPNWHPVLEKISPKIDTPF